VLSPSRGSWADAGKKAEWIADLENMVEIEQAELRGANCGSR